MDNYDNSQNRCGKRLVGAPPLSGSLYTTSASNQSVERWFALLTEKQIKRGCHAFRVAVKHGIATKVPVYETRWDVVRRAHISRIHGEQGPGNQPGNRALFNRVDVHAHTKRQLSKQELARYALKG